MIELATNQNGERVPLHADMAECKVMRQFHGKPGGLSNVAGSNGMQLYIPRGTTTDEFRQYVGHVPARYRLVQVDKDRRAIPGAEAFHLEILDASSAGSGRSDSGDHDERDYVRELVRANADMVKVVAERFAGMMDAAATLIRAADGAGLPAREPIANAAALPSAPVVEEVEEAPQAGLAHVLQETLAKATPLLNHLVLTKVVGLSNEQAVQLLGGGVAPKPANDPRPPGVPHTSPVTAHVPAPSAPVDFVAHLNAIERALGDEAAGARALVMAMSPDEISVWRNRIGALAVPDAVAAVRAQLAQRKAGGAS